MSAVNRALSKSLRLQNTYTRQAARSVSLLNAGGASSRASGFSARNLSRTTTTTRSSPFHTMASLQSGAPAKPSEGVGYDPEIKDIANYIHNYKIDSELAVSFPQRLHSYPARPAANRTTTNQLSSTPRASFSSIRSVVVWRACASKNAQSFSAPLSPGPPCPTAPRSLARPSSLTPSMVPSTLAP